MFKNVVYCYFSLSKSKLQEYCLRNTFKKLILFKSVKRDADSGAPSDKAGYRNSIMLSFQTNPEYGHSILMALCVSGDS